MRNLGVRIADLERSDLAPDYSAVNRWVERQAAEAHVELLRQIQALQTRDEALGFFKEWNIGIRMFDDLDRMSNWYRPGKNAKLMKETARKYVPHVLTRFPRMKRAIEAEIDGLDGTVPEVVAPQSSAGAISR